MEGFVHTAIFFLYCGAHGFKQRFYFYHSLSGVCYCLYMFNYINIPLFIDLYPI